MLQDLIGKLATVPTERRLVVKEEEDSEWAGFGAGAGTKKREEVQHAAGIDEWSEGGILRIEWLRRDRRVLLTPLSITLLF